MKSLFITYKNIDPSSVTSLAIGGFDGIHLAHQKLLSQLDERGALLAIEKPVMGLTPRRAREYFCDKPIFYLDLKDVMQLGSDEFLRILLAEFTGLKKIVVGYDFRFGKGRVGGIEDIRRAFGGSVCVVEDVQLEGASIHATDIISLVRAGELKRANFYLGRAYMLEGAVIRGQGLGAKSLYPTINLQVAGGYTVPKEGVYVGQTEIVEVFETPSGDQDQSGDDANATSAQDLSSTLDLNSATTTQDLGFSASQDLSRPSAQDLSSARTCDLSLARTLSQDLSLSPTTNRELTLNMARSTTQDLASTQDPNPARAQDLSQTSTSAKLYPSVIFVGHRLSTDGSFCIETHILGGAANFNAKKVKLHFLGFLRENKKFSDLSQLKASITADINKARSYFA
ncbi:MAG: riboflavin kinase [Helicobacteraceae bacterium]